MPLGADGMTNINASIIHVMNPAALSCCKGIIFHKSSIGSPNMC